MERVGDPQSARHFARTHRSSGSIHSQPSRVEDSNVLATSRALTVMCIHPRRRAHQDARRPHQEGEDYWRHPWLPQLSGLSLSLYELTSQPGSTIGIANGSGNAGDSGLSLT